MKPTNDPQRELLEDVFSPSAEGDALPIDEVLRVIRREKQARARRRSVVTLVACAILALATFSSVWTSRPQRPKQPEHPSPLVAANTVISPQQDVPHIERVSDEGALALLDSTPSAVVQWPDGRRTLMILVSARP
jgi:hypothetical protein